MDRLPLTNLRLLGSALLGSLVLAAALFFQPSLPTEDRRPQPGLSDEPDLVIEGAVIKQYRDTGDLRYLLRSPRIEHYQDQALTLLNLYSLFEHIASPSPS